MTEIEGEYNIELDTRVSLDNTEAQYEVLKKKVAGYSRIPNRVVDMEGLHPLALALYVHIKRIAGDKGACWMSSENIATKMCMSEGSVSNFKKELVDAGLINIEWKKSDRGGRPYHYITIVDVWDLDKPIKSCGELPSSPHENLSSSGESKKTTIKKTQIPLAASKIEAAQARIESLFDKEPPPQNSHRTKEELQAATVQSINAFNERGKKNMALENDKQNFSAEIPVNIRGLAEAFISGFGRIPTKKEKAYWIACWNEQYEIGLTPRHIEAAFSRMKQDGLTIKSPDSVKAIAEDIKRSQNDNPYHGASEVWGSEGRIV